MATPTDFLLLCVAAGSVALLALMMHLSLRDALRSATAAEMQGRDRAVARAQRLWWGVVVATIATIAAGFVIRPGFANGFASTPLASAFPVVALAGLMGVALCRDRNAEMLAWLSSCALLTGGLATAAFVVGVGPI